MQKDRYLFRGQKVDAKEWVYGYYMFHETKNKHVILTKESKFIEVIPETVGQFTGLTDKNGVEIYEHDIIKFLIDNEKYVVQFEEGAFCLVSNNVCGIISMYDFENLEYEVIGNIHENPELL